MKRFKVYWNIIVENNMVADFDTLDEAKHYCDENTKEYEECTGNCEICSDNFCYEVYDGEKDILDEDGNVVDFHEPVYETAYFWRTLQQVSEITEKHRHKPEGIEIENGGDNDPLKGVDFKE